MIRVNHLDKQERQIKPMPTRPNSPINSIVYMDYENIQELLRQYGKDPLALNFFPVILEKFKNDGLNLFDFIVYHNFERKQSNNKLQTYLRTLGLQTRQSSTSGKNCGDLELTVDALRTLYKTPGVSLYILITSDRDIIPLLKSIKLEGKLSYLISTRNGFNQIVAEYADFHEYLEDIFNLGAPIPVEQKPLDPDPTLNPDALTETDIEQAREVSRLFYRSNIWRRAVQLGEPVSLTGYARVIARAVSRLSGEILDDFKLAHALQYITIYHGPDQRLFIKEGPKKDECL